MVDPLCPVGRHERGSAYKRHQLDKYSNKGKVKIKISLLQAMEAHRVARG
jgi:hypothetical protein